MSQSPFRRVQLPSSIPGHLYLTCMPGYHREAAHHLAHWDALSDEGAVYVVCLTGAQEKARKAPDYQEFLDGIAIGVRWIEFPIPDYSAPADRNEFLAILDRLCGLLQSSAAVLVIHCAAGVGRTGMAAASLLARMGLPEEESLARIKAAGSAPETAQQLAFFRSIIPVSGRHPADDQLQQRE